MLKTALRYKGLMNAGYTVKPEDTPGNVMQCILMIQDEIAEYEKKEQKKVERKMKAQSRGL